MEKVLESRRRPNYKIASYLRSRYCKALKQQKIIKSKKLLELLGCSLDELKLHISKQFRNGMTWENYGKIWHIDHITPCSKLNLQDEEELRICFNYNNLQPMLAKENLIKNNKLKSNGPIAILSYETKTTI